MKVNKDKFTTFLLGVIICAVHFGIWVYVFLQIADGKF